MGTPDVVSLVEQICRTTSIRNALAKFLNVPADQLENLEIGQTEAINSELLTALNALDDGRVAPDRFSSDQVSLLSTALRLTEQEVLYLLECAAKTSAEQGRFPL